MQYKFKNSCSTEVRKSGNNHHSQSLKNQTLPYLNLLDKCTQILREDRIWLRNQMKAGDTEVITIFKQARKPLNLQHLQIRLRKHVAAIKSKAKMEQLMRFKENMNLGEWGKSREHEKCEEVAHSKQTGFAHTMNRTIQNSSSLNHGASHGKNYRARMNNSIERPDKPVIYPYRNNCATNVQSNSRKALQEYPAPMEEITERDSQNMTSARNRIAMEQHGQGSGFGINNGYHQWTRPNNFTSPLDGLKKQMKETYGGFSNLQDKADCLEPEIRYPRKMQKQVSPQKDIYEHYYGRRSLSKGSPSDYEEQEYDPPKSITSMNIENNNMNSEEQMEVHCNTLFQRKTHNDFQNISNYGYSGLSHFEEAQERISKEDFVEYPVKKTQSNTKFNDGLFTSPEFLEECRNFIKTKSSAKSSLQKDNDLIFHRGALGSETTYLPLSFDQTTPQIQTKIENNQHLIESINVEDREKKFNLNEITTQSKNHLSCGFIDSVKVSEPVSDQKAQNVISQVKQKSKMEPPHEDFNKTYEFFHTFANQSSQKKQMKKEKFNNAEEFIDQLLSNLEDESPGYIKWATLLNIIERRCPEFITTFIQYLKPEAGQQYVLISNGGRVMEDLLQNEHPVQNQVYNIYHLLDIEQKGYITQQDIQDFVSQLEDAEAEDVQMIAKCLWKLFESIDEDSQESEEKRIDYWGIYSRKNGRQLVELSQLLKQFQFQIE